MAIVTTDNKHYNDIADALRTATGTEETYKPEEMAEGIGEVFDKGAENFFHKVILRNGSRKQIDYLFHQAADASNYTFPSGYKPTSTSYLFYSYKGEYLPKGLDLSSISSTSSTNGYDWLFYGAGDLISIYDVKFTKVPYRLYYTFASCGDLVNIDSTIPIGESTMFTDPFRQCSSLEEVRFSGTIGKSFTMSGCPKLSAESVKSIITHLKVGTSTSNIGTLTLKQAAFDRLVAAEPTVEWNGEQVTWEDYLANIKWGLSLSS